MRCGRFGSPHRVHTTQSIRSGMCCCHFIRFRDGLILDFGTAIRNIASSKTDVGDASWSVSRGCMAVLINWYSSPLPGARKLRLKCALTASTESSASRGSLRKSEDTNDVIGFHAVGE